MRQARNGQPTKERLALEAHNNNTTEAVPSPWSSTTPQKSLLPSIYSSVSASTMGAVENLNVTTPQECANALDEKAITANSAMLSNFHEDGFIVLPSFLSLDMLQEWKTFCEQYFATCFHTLHQNGHTRAPTHQLTENEYVFGLGVKHGFREIVMRSPGRYELSFVHSHPPGNMAHISHSISPPDTSRILERIQHLLPQLLCSDNRSTSNNKSRDEAQCPSSYADYKQVHLSLLVATPGCPDQAWHADGGHVSLQQHLPCHCLNVFIPLQDTPQALGPTEFRPGGHYLTRGNLARTMLAAKCRKTLRPPTCPELSFGDVLMFDYRVLHRGRANTSMDTNRNVLVFTFCKPWFKDVLNFPKRSMMLPAGNVVGISEEADDED